MTSSCRHPRSTRWEATRRPILCLDTTDYGVLVCSPESITSSTADFMNIWDFLIRVFPVKLESRIVFGRFLGRGLLDLDIKPGWRESPVADSPVSLSRLFSQEGTPVVPCQQNHQANPIRSQADDLVKAT